MTSVQEQIEELTESKTKVRKHHKVILLNDEDHTYDYVVEILTKICRMSRDQAFRCAVEVDVTGRTTVFYGNLEKCEHVASRIKNYGPDHRLARSMNSMQAIVDSCD